MFLVCFGFLAFNFSPLSSRVRHLRTLIARYIYFLQHNMPLRNLYLKPVSIALGRKRFNVADVRYPHAYVQYCYKSNKRQGFSTSEAVHAAQKMPVCSE